MEPNNLYKKVEQHVTGLFNEHKDLNLVFHNLEHTIKVVERTKEISGHYFLSEIDMLALYTAAWFHDTGYLFTDQQHHEEKSIALMHEFMTSISAEQELKEKIEQCIIATRMPHKHEHLMEQIICDADSYHFGTKEFKDSNNKVWEENNLKDTSLSQKVWSEKTLSLLTNHTFYTKYCQDLLQKRKQKNIEKIKKVADGKDKEVEMLSLNNLEKDKTGLISKGIQTMLRLTSQNQLHLSDMADQKANILISVNAIIISVILSVLIRKLDAVPYLVVPTIIFLLVAVITIVISIIATRPKISGGTFSSQDIIDKKVNLMFFGNFHKATFEEYNSAMRIMMQDTDYLYESLIKDIYALAIVLGRKYKLIRLAYNIFMIGIIISVIAFVIAVFFFQPAETNTIIHSSGSPF